MNEFYMEKIVKPRVSIGDKCFVIGPFTIGLISLIRYGVIEQDFTNFNIILILLSLLVIVLSVISFMNLDREYEYQCTNGDFDFDKIIRKTKRKSLFSINETDIVLLAPMGTKEEVQYKGVTEYYFTSKEPGKALYKLVFKQGEKMLAIIFEPSEEMVEKLWTCFPRKVVK